MKKRGISLTTLSIGIVIMIILLSTISISISYSINNAKKRTFAEEIYNLQSLVNEYVQRENVLPVTNSLKLQPSDTEQFEGEEFTDDEIILNVIDLALLDVKNTTYGNAEIGDTDEEKAKDVYAISQTTGRVYYIAGFKTDEKTYYTLTDELLNMVEQNQNLVISEASIIFAPSTIGWSNEGISVRASVPAEYEVTSITIDNTNISYTTETVNSITYYNVNAAKVAEDYTVTISYTKDGIAGTVSYTARIDVTAPVISKDTEVENTAVAIKGLTATDNESGIRYFKYAQGVIGIADAKTYMNAHGTSINGGTIKFIARRPYTIYAEDKAGNYTVMYMDEDGNLTTTKLEEYTYPTIPEGFVPSAYAGEQKVREGLVIYETDSLEGISQETAMTTYNQYVWVPVEDFTKFERTTTYDGTITALETSFTEPYSYDTTITEINDLTGEYAEYAKMKASVQENKGFYIGRYEAGTTNTRKYISNGTTDVLVQKNKPVYNYIGWGQSMTDIEGDITDTHDGYNQGKGAVELSRSIYPESVNNDVVSTLIYGVQWDAALKFISKTDAGYALNSTDKGNYTGTLLNTGSNDAYAKNNIYDMAGNMCEWIMESYSNNARVLRGGSYISDGLYIPASCRLYEGVSYAWANYGFRVALYLK